MNYLRKLPKIFFLLFLLLLFFGFGLLYNDKKEGLAQERAFMECEEEIPIGEIIEETFQFVKEVNQNVQTIYSTAPTQIGAAKTLAQLPEECKAENCDTNCEMEYKLDCKGECDDVTVDDDDCSLDPDECPFQNCTGSCADIVDHVCITGGVCPDPLDPSCDCVTTPGTCCYDKITTCNCGPPGSCDLTSDFCHEISPEVWCWGVSKKCGDPGICTASCVPNVCPVGSTGPDCCWFLGPTGEYCWEATAAGQYCDCRSECDKIKWDWTKAGCGLGPGFCAIKPWCCTCDAECPVGEPFCFEVGTHTKCWGDNECSDKSAGGKCEEKCDETFSCDILPCEGEPCPWAEIQNQVDTITNAYNTIHTAKVNIDALIPPRRDEILAKLDIAREQLSDCTTSADAMIKGEVIGEMLLICEDVKFGALLPEGQDCAHLHNFFCCSTRYEE